MIEYKILKKLWYQHIAKQKQPPKEVVVFVKVLSKNFIYKKLKYIR